MADSVCEIDVLIVGAGMGGVLALRKITAELGLDALIIDKAPGIGGTWYWNRYPGSLSDTQAPMYQLPFEKELYQANTWRNRYATGPEIRQYLEGAVDFWGLRSRVMLDTEMTHATFDDRHGVWRVETTAGVFRARFLITSLGLLSKRNQPDFPGMETFAGQVVHTAEWPDDLDISGKRLGVIGNGSTGVQFMTEAAKSVAHLTSFQRTPQYTVPAGNREYSAEELQQFKDNCEQMWDNYTREKIGFGVDEVTRKTFDVSPEERERIYEWAWQKGGNYTFATETFSDVTGNHAANKEAADFIRKKISQIVNDPETARRLTPWEIYARRPICDSGYYQIFNQPNVELVSLRETPIEAVVPEGIRTADGRIHEIDVLVMATGFDAVDGSYRGVDIRGRDGERLEDHWADGPTSQFGITVSGFPNMFMILGPNGPFVNNPAGIGIQARWITRAISALKDTAGATIELRPEAEEAWLDTCLAELEGSLFLETGSWIFGSNIPGKRKKRTANFYVGGLDKYIRLTDAESSDGYPSYSFHVPAAV
ncbi:flavin-containing monooxygenase [Micromonospora sp. NPDC048830]|uniref:flavin-containing monooxygenase n=1 Tax=Micromonospora sp. NPDC048830 TaxID=3364257 RepID=UPI0037132A3A